MDIEYIIEEVIKRVNEKFKITVEASGKHVHLSRESIDTLFGKGYKLTEVKKLSQPGQYSCNERVSLTGPKGTIKNVVVLGPERTHTQAEISKSDAVILGVKAPIRESGKLQGSAGVTISTEKASLTIKEGLIVAKRHIHLTLEDAKLFKVRDKDIVKVEVSGERPLIFDDVVIRVKKEFRTFMHIDYDEANACGYNKGTTAKIIK
ncbi:phosphate propanoyltransferase [Clostridium sp. CM028]|uniref:ethanolamine utilization phosphate acetyltransferase EutD n=1 Tax=Clostridium sp. CF011 TaxID=2843318 RepID=UPI001651BBA3|nr:MULTISPECIES: ethanolamine utilization phosphate acetyltransferase EutD [Clostridium]MBU3092667.1 phosphate propanoyltransferase [Clostridium sp. CF011]MBW9145291.1 phosphate propanoyltransferase [Clostridium sp. CM027]MBW9148895.1 phosphate propanoyltransferase [Clostridium sp. CM028]MBZ9606964.1 phosphate propanoyltransferase [Clostridium estertheticum]UVE42678.1 phosphate propanoyltransferase [Clostridium sp. CM027]